MNRVHAALTADTKARFDVEKLITSVQRAIQIPSVFGHEREVGLYLESLMRELGYAGVERQEVAPDRFNVVGTYNYGRGSGRRVLLQGHMDTVPFGEHPEPTSGRLGDGVIWGRGASDMKGPLVAAIFAASLAPEFASGLQGECVVAATVDEESEKRGIFGLVDSALHADYGICVEPTDLRLAIAQKGCVSMRVDTHGRAAHGANPTEGINAIRKMARVVEAIEGAVLPTVDLPNVGEVHGTYNVGVIEGGHMFFIVPDRCSVWVDRRTVPGESQQDALRLLEELTRSVDAESTVVLERQDWQWERIRARGIGSYVTSVSEPIVAAVVDAANAVTGHAPELYVQTAWCETDFIVNDLKIPAVTFGPGKMELAHTSNEHIEVDSLLKGTEILARSVAGICTD